MNEQSFDIFLITAPGLQNLTAEEARALGFKVTSLIPGGVTMRGGWADVWRANLCLRGATRVLVRIGEFRALHLAQLDKRARKFPWADLLPNGIAVKVEATCRKSRIYHAGAATERIEGALRDTIGATTDKADGLVVRLRIEDDLCTLSLDTSGETLHKRGHKVAVNKAPMRETLAALFLRACGYDGTMPVYDPMCGSGTFVIEAAEIALGLPPGRSRGFAFEGLKTFDPTAWAAMKGEHAGTATTLRFFGSDRDAGAVRMSIANAERAGVAGIASFENRPIAEATPPDGPPGLVIVNPPYGARIGEAKALFGLYGAMGARLMQNFAGWRVGVITSDAGLARATGLPFGPPGPVADHGGIKVRLYQTPALAAQ